MPGEFWHEEKWSLKFYPQTLDAKTLLRVGVNPDKDTGPDRDIMPFVWFEESPPGPPLLGMSAEERQERLDTTRTPPADVLRGDIVWKINFPIGYSLDGRSEHCTRTKPGDEDSIGPYFNSEPVENTKVNPTSAKLAQKGEQF